MSLGWLAVGLVATGAAVAAAPLAVYGLVIALFGLPHVLAELRYLDLRYSADLRRTVLVPVLLILLAACACRVASSYALLPRGTAVTAELLLVAASALPLQRVMGSRRWLSWVAMATVGLAAAVAPFHTLLLLAVAHNLTPIGFIGHALLRRPERRAAAALGLLVFAIIPAALALGLGAAAMAWLGIAPDPDAMLVPSGGLGRSIGTAVPPEITDPDIAINLFAAAVFLQCAHYVAVIHVMPRLLAPARPPSRLLAWPGHGWMRAALVLIGLATGLAFIADFGEARRVYAIIAAFHAWIEVPILLLMLGGRLSPAPTEAGSPAR